VATWRAVARVLRSSADCVISATLPGDCRLCELSLDGASRLPVCRTCLEQLIATSAAQSSSNAQFCSCCATRLDAGSFSARQDGLCEECRATPPPFAGVVASGQYDGTLRQLIHLLKFERVTSVAALLAERMAEALDGALLQTQAPLLITAVPLFSRKQSERGFNQSRLLAQELVTALRRRGWDVRGDYALLLRKRETRSQSELNLSQRRANLRGVFGAGKNAAMIRDANILLIDDIVTTTATARQCSAVLVKAGAAQVWVATAARSQKVEVAGWGTPQ